MKLIIKLFIGDNQSIICSLKIQELIFLLIYKMHHFGFIFIISQESVWFTLKISILNALGCIQELFFGVSEFRRIPKGNNHTDMMLTMITLTRRFN